MFQVNPLLDSHEKSSFIFFKRTNKKLKCRLPLFLFGALRVNLFKTRYSFLGVQYMQTLNLVQMPPNVASNHCLHCLLTNFFM